MAGHPQEASGEGSVWAAVSDWGSLRPEEERGGGSHRPRYQNRECLNQRGDIVFCLFNAPWQRIFSFHRINVVLREQSSRESEQRGRRRSRPDLRYDLSEHYVISSHFRTSKMWQYFLLLSHCAAYRRKKRGGRRRSIARSMMQMPIRRRPSQTWLSSTVLGRRSFNFLLPSVQMWNMMNRDAKVPQKTYFVWLKNYTDRST